MIEFTFDTKKGVVVERGQKKMRDDEESKREDKKGKDKREEEP